MIAIIIVLVLIALVLVLLLLWAGLAFYCYQEPEITYDLEKYAGVYYHAGPGSMEYIVFRADSTYSYFFANGADTVGNSGKWDTGREITHSFSIPEMDFFNIYDFRWPGSDVVFTMKASYWNPLSVTLASGGVGDEHVFQRVETLAMADSLGIKIGEEDFVPLPPNIDSSDFFRAWVDCTLDY